LREVAQNRDLDGRVEHAAGLLVGVGNPAGAGLQDALALHVVEKRGRPRILHPEEAGVDDVGRLAHHRAHGLVAAEMLSLPTVIELFINVTLANAVKDA
jgi:hypothetical protein